MPGSRASTDPEHKSPRESGEDSEDESEILEESPCGRWLKRREEVRFFMLEVSGFLCFFAEPSCPHALSPCYQQEVAIKNRYHVAKFVMKKAEFSISGILISKIIIFFSVKRFSQGFPPCRLNFTILFNLVYFQCRFFLLFF